MSAKTACFPGFQGVNAYVPGWTPLETNTMTVDLKSITELFLTPSSILVGALGVARTEPLKTGISGLGLVASILWIVCSSEALEGDTTWRAWVLSRPLPILFIVCWAIATIVHAVLWLTGRGEQKRRGLFLPASSPGAD